MRLFTFVLLGLLSFNTAQAQSANSANLIAVGQGISSPTATSTVNFSSGYTSESPLGVLYQTGARVTGQYDKNGSEAFGGEIGYGRGDWGLAAGYRKQDCDGCDGRFAGALGVTVADIGVGLRFAEDLYAAGILLNPQGTHRLGLMAEFDQSGGDGADINAFGAGYSYVSNQFTFSIDASKRTYENDSVDDDRILVTPGIMLRADIFQLSVNDEITLNRDKDNPAQDGDDHQIWFGVGIGGDTWHIAGYVDYVNELAIAGTLFF